MKIWLDIPEETARLKALQEAIKSREYVYAVCRKYGS